MDLQLIESLAINCGAFEPTALADADAKGNLQNNGYSQIPSLTPHDYEKVRSYVQRELRTKLSPEEINRGTRDRGIRSNLRAIVSRALVECNIQLGQQAIEILVEELGNDCLGFGPIEKYFYDQEVTEIKASASEIRVEKGGRETIIETIGFRDETHIRDVLDRMLAPTGRSISPNNPRVDATLFDGSRLKAHIPPVSPKGTIFTIRRFRQDMTIPQMIASGAMSQAIADFLAAAVLAKINIIVSGGTSSGKTTMLNVIAGYIPEAESIITIEDPAELDLQHNNVRSLEARPANNEGKGEVTLRTLVQDALRMAPRRIILGECRGGEAFDMLQAMNTGHEGSLTTGHANSAYLMTKRLIAMVQMAEMDLPYDAIVEQIAVINLIVQVVKESRTGKRRVDHIAEVVGVKRNEEGVLEIALNMLWQYNQETGQFDWVAQEFKHREQLVAEGGWQTCCT